MYHLSVLDAMTTCNCFSVCLEEIKQWSDMHPAHHILFVTIELKVYGDFLQVGGTFLHNQLVGDPCTTPVIYENLLNKTRAL